MEKTGMIFNLQPFSVHDGPGIRTTVFLKGCNLRCLWCHNPESWRAGPELLFYPEKCIGCGACFSACPTGAHQQLEDSHRIERELCTQCGACADVCYAKALTLTGDSITASQLLALILKDRLYFENGEGGVTFSGGEPMMQLDFLEEILHLCKKEGLHTAVDTAGYQPFTSFERILPYTDLFLYDLKAFHPARHMALTGVSNDRVFENLALLLDAGARVIVRIPCIGEANLEDVPALAEFLAGRPVEMVELLPYHRLGEGKFSSLDKDATSFTTPSAEQMVDLAAVFEKASVPVRYTKP